MESGIISKEVMESLDKYNGFGIGYKSLLMLVEIRIYRENLYYQAKEEYIRVHELQEDYSVYEISKLLGN